MPRVDNKTGNGFSEYAYSIVGVATDGRRVSRTVPEVGAPQMLEMLKEIDANIRYGFGEYDARESALIARNALIKAMRRPPLLGYTPKPKS
jgi:hypothetical protein